MKLHALCAMMTALTWGVKAMSSNRRGVRGNLTDPREGQSKHFCARGPPGEFGTILAEKANLTVSKANEGTLTISGPSVAKIRILADRPVRMSESVDTAIFIKQFKQTFSTSAPNAVLSGIAEGGELRDVTIVLESAEYFAQPTIPPFVTFAWKSDDEKIDQNLELKSASLFIDSFRIPSCIAEDPKAFFENTFCRNMVYDLAPESAAERRRWGGPPKEGGLVECRKYTQHSCSKTREFFGAADGSGKYTQACTAAADKVCPDIGGNFPPEVATQIFDRKTLTVDQFCKSRGFGNPCPGLYG